MLPRQASEMDNNKKHSFSPCPKCGAIVNTEDDNTGLIIQFAPQDINSPLRPKGTIFFVLCLDCGYIGPLVLCSMGMSKRMIAEAWNNHINPLPSVTTCDLVRELLKRDETILWNELGNDDDTHRDNIDFSLHEPIYGPAKILVVSD
jgi:hypothetical protein